MVAKYLIETKCNFFFVLKQIAVRLDGQAWYTQLQYKTVFEYLQQNIPDWNE